MAKLNPTTTNPASNPAATETAAELVAISSCCTVVQYELADGSNRAAVKLHNLRFLPARMDAEGRPQSARFSGILEYFQDPVTGEVRGKNRDGVPLRFFGAAAEQLAAILEARDENGELAIPDPKRDSVLLALNGDPAELFLSIYRDATGSVTGAGASTREFRGNFRGIKAAPAAVVIAE